MNKPPKQSWFSPSRAEQRRDTLIQWAAIAFLATGALLMLVNRIPFVFNAWFLWNQLS